MEIWIHCYEPFIMGGDVHAPVMTEMPVAGPFDIGAGYRGFIVIAPSGKTFVVEGVTGAIVGSTIEQVRADIATAVRENMAIQIRDAEKWASQARMVKPEEFWKHVNK